MFKKVVENFICEHCKTEVKGDGFTNHCPKCLWAKHVDINPGDRMENCKGLMEPISVESKREGEVLVHKCLSCGAIRRNRVSVHDDFDTVLQISKKVADNFAKDVISL